MVVAFLSLMINLMSAAVVVVLMVEAGAAVVVAVVVIVVVVEAVKVLFPFRVIGGLTSGTRGNSFS